MIDYKITNFKINNRGISATVNVYKGDVTTEDEQVAGGDTEAVTRYRRSQKVKSVDINLDPLQVSRLFEKYVNKKIQAEAAKIGETIISEQDSTSV